MPGTFRIWTLVCDRRNPDRVRFCPSSSRPDRLGQARSRFEKETDPVHRAKLIVPLGNRRVRSNRTAGRRQRSRGGSSIGLQTTRTRLTSCEKGAGCERRRCGKTSVGLQGAGDFGSRVAAPARQCSRAICSGDEQKPFLDVRKTLDEHQSSPDQGAFPAPTGDHARFEPSRKN